MNRIRGSIHALLSRCSKKDLRSEAAAAKREEQSHTAPQPPKRKTSTTNAGFNVFQARIYTKGERNNYHYSPIPVAKLPTFQIDPPDDIPFQLSVAEEQHQDLYVVTPPPSPTEGKFWKPPLTIDTKQVVLLGSTPPSPPSSLGSISPDEYKYEYQSPTRAPPSPPTTPQLSTNSPFINASDDILIHIFSYLDSPSSMEALSLAHPRFYTVLAPNKLFIFRAVVKNTSTSASYLVELLKPSGAYTAKSYSESYAFSLEVVRTIKTLIQSRCRFFLTSGKMDFLNDGAEKAFDDALYNIWTFCLLFRDRADDVETQMRWLRKFGPKELLDILEIWQCLGVLLRPLAECPKLALKHGIIKSRPPTSNNSKVIIELGKKLHLFKFRDIGAYFLGI